MSVDKGKYAPVKYVRSCECHYLASRLLRRKENLGIEELERNRTKPIEALLGAGTFLWLFPYAILPQLFEPPII